MKVKPIGSSSEPPQHYSFLCPGCNERHIFNASWSYNSDGNLPTVSPSILVTGGPEPGYRCHSYIEAGRIRFLPDCSHELAGQTVDLPELPE